MSPGPSVIPDDDGFTEPHWAASTASVLSPGTLAPSVVVAETRVGAPVRAHASLPVLVATRLQMFPSIVGTRAPGEPTLTENDSCEAEHATVAGGVWSTPTEELGPSVTARSATVPSAVGASRRRGSFMRAGNLRGRRTQGILFLPARALAPSAGAGPSLLS